MTKIYTLLQKEPASITQFHKYVPANRLLFDMPEHWNSLKLEVFDFPSMLEGPNVSSTDHAFGVRHSGVCTKSSFYINDELAYKGSLEPGSIAIAPRLQSGRWNWQSANGSEIIRSTVLHLPHVVMERTILETLDIDPDHVELIPGAGIHDNVITKIAKQLRYNIEQAHLIDRLLSETLTQHFIAHLLSRHTTHRHKIAEYQIGLHKKSLKQVINYIHDNINKSIALNDMAATVGLSAYHFARLFKKAAGVPPHQYVIHCRMKKAKQLLIKSRLAVTEIALDVGYEDVSNFINAFKKTVGITPRKYRHL